MTDDFDPTTMLAWVTSPNDLTNLTGILAHHHDPVTIDLETTGLDEHATGDGPREVPARIVLASVTFDYVGRTRTWVIPLSHPDSPFRGQWRAVATTVAQALARHDLIGHNLKFDLRWLYAHTGVDLSTRLLWDSEVSSHLLDENQSTKLKERAPDTFGVTRWDDFDLSRPGAAEDVPLFDLGVYAARDTYWTHRLAYNHRSIMWVDLTGVEPWEQPEDDDEREVANLGQLAERVSMPATRTLCQMEQHGLALDTEWTRTTLAELEETAARLAAEMGARYPDADLPGVQSFAATSRWFLGWTEAAVDAGDLVVGELTPTGKPRWSKAVLVRLERKGYPLAGVMLEHRSAVKRAEFLRSWLAKVSPAGGIHATYRIGSVVTGRLSSSSPNMQQVTKALKPAFVPEPGHVLAELDYCLEGSQRILTSDLRWVSADQIQVGQKIVAFPETVGKGAGHGHNYEESEVTSVKTLTRPSVIVMLSDGRHVKCSREHRWMTYPVGGKGARQWTAAGDLVPGQIIPTLTDPWDEPDPVDAAYLRGFLDGEGWVSDTVTGWGQLPGAVRDEVVACSARLGIKWRQANHLTNGVEQHIVTTMSESLRILGMIRPHRLLPKARQVWEGRRTYGKYQTGVVVVDVIDAGERPVVAVGTAAKTMVVEGLLSHNSQIELRVAAFISRCAPMIEAFQRGDDLHTLLASRITGKAAADVTPTERQAGKSANFGLLYGMGVDGFREYAETVYGVALTEDEAAVIHRTFFLMWDGISAWHQRAIATAHRHGQITSPLGRVRRVPDVHDGNPSRAAEAERAAVNSPVQGMASDLMQIAAASIAGNLPGIPPVDGATLVGTVHDSILVQVPADRWETVTRQCQERMERVGEYVARYFYTTIDVPLVADYTVGTRWGLTDVYDPG